MIIERSISSLPMKYMHYTHVWEPFRIPPSLTNPAPSIPPPLHISIPKFDRLHFNFQFLSSPSPSPLLPQPPTRTPPLLTLPTELILQIYTHLHWADALALALSSKSLLLISLLVPVRVKGYYVPYSGAGVKGDVEGSGGRFVAHMDAVRILQPFGRVEPITEGEEGGRWRWCLGRGCKIWRSVREVDWVLGREKDAVGVGDGEGGGNEGRMGKGRRVWSEEDRGRAERYLGLWCKGLVDVCPACAGFGSVRAVRVVREEKRRRPWVRRWCW